MTNHNEEDECLECVCGNNEFILLFPAVFKFITNEDGYGELQFLNYRLEDNQTDENTFLECTVCGRRHYGISQEIPVEAISSEDLHLL